MKQFGYFINNIENFFDNDSQIFKTMMEQIKKHGGDRKVELSNTVYFLYNIYVIMQNSAQAIFIYKLLNTINIYDPTKKVPSMNKHLLERLFL
jgi:hypothetical protein